MRQTVFKSERDAASRIPGTLRIACVMAIVLPLSGCRKNVVAAAPPPPPLPATTSTVSVPPPVHPTEPLPDEPLVATDSLPLSVELPRRPQSRRRTQTAPPPNQTASVTAPITDLGELTTGGESNNDAFRHETEDLLRTQSRRIAGLSRSTIALHTRQVEQARLFLKQANEAWNKQDIEGARTLGIKAKVVLDEILG